MEIIKITKENDLFDYKKLAKLDYTSNISFYETEGKSLEELENAYKDFVDSDETLYVGVEDGEYKVTIALDEFNDNYFTMMFNENEVNGQNLVDLINYMLEDFIDPVTLHTNVYEDDDLLVDALGLCGFEFYEEEGSNVLAAEISK